MNKITELLTMRFKEHRIIFWYDEKTDFLEHYQELNLEGIQKIHVEGNEFAVKFLTEKKHPYGKFLLYFSKPRPQNEDNWLLDMELAYYVFRTDQEALFLQEMELGYHLKEFITAHLDFFKAKERRTKLKELLGTNKDISEQHIRYNMLAVVFNSDYLDLSHFLFIYANALLEENERIDKELERYKLKTFFWEQVARLYHYQNENPSIYDFLLEVFANNISLNGKNNLSKESRLFLADWKDRGQFKATFEQLSQRIAEDLAIEHLLNQAQLDDIIHDDLFKLTDIRIIHELIEQTLTENITHEKLIAYIKQRQNKFWYPQVATLYQCILEGSELMTLIGKLATVRYHSFEEGTDHYSQMAYQVDLHYRKFVWLYRKAKQNIVLGELATKIEKRYTNDWLLPYNDQWQKIVDSLATWPNSLQHGQRRFYNTHVKPILDKKQRLFVIVSDALRYECGTELHQRFQTEKFFDASLSYGVSSLPSYTQLGMASLLPHKQLSVQENSDSIVLDGMSSSGLQARKKILENNSDVRTTTLSAEEFMTLNAHKEGREFVKQYDLLYLYHNRIDKTGDDKITEEKVFEAVEEELSFLIEVSKKIASMNGTNILITADHGFLYQYGELQESDFSQSVHTGEIWKENRRFIMGRNLTSDATTKSFKGNDLGLQPELDILIPKSINRLRVKGAGSRFVHGGASLQEIMTPILKIRRRKEDTTSEVEIDLIKSTDRITTNLLAVSFIQTDVVTEQLLARTIRAGIYAEDGELLSDQFKYVFDMQEGLERQREVKHRFQISSKATTKYKNQRVKLMLEEPVEGSTKWRFYKEFYYTLNISFTSDFD